MTDLKKTLASVNTNDWLHVKFPASPPETNVPEASGIALWRGSALYLQMATGAEAALMTESGDVRISEILNHELRHMIPAPQQVIEREDWHNYVWPPGITWLVAGERYYAASRAGDLPLTAEGVPVPPEDWPVRIYRLPSSGEKTVCVVTSLEVVDALAAGAVVRDAEGNYGVFSRGFWRVNGRHVRSDSLALPVTVLFGGAESGL